MDRVEIRPDNAYLIADDPRIETELRREFWYRGMLEHQLRPSGQSEAYDFVRKLSKQNAGAQPITIETHRRFGKSHFMCMLACERALRQPGAFIKYAAPGKEQCQKIVIPNLYEVLRYCPEELRPKRVKHEWYFRNPRWDDQTSPSVLQIEGVNDDPDALRGSPCDLALLDEAAFMEKLDYVWRDVILPMFVGRPEPMAVFASTPPKSMAHPWITRFLPIAKTRGRYFRMRGSDNDDFSAADERMMLDELGGKSSPSWRREIECEHLTDEEALICPEFLEARKDVMKEVDRPPWFVPIVSADLGWKDFTHILFGYIDFLGQRLIIEDEIRVHYETPGQLVERWLEMEARLWSDTPPEPLVWPKMSRRYRCEYRELVKRFADTPPLTLEGLARDHGLAVSAVLKYDRDRAIAAFRQALKQRKVIIHPRCKQLEYQLLNGVWDERRKKFMSSEELGHCDGISAAIYMLRMAPWKKNPFPGERPMGLSQARRPGTVPRPKGGSFMAEIFGA